ncbi:DUF6053 domain-containing protein [Lysobacter enzymogenes]|uniref:DUF6053 domain-containing protein n=1 Tax=Lysobacter enzymogenes TaxID=69 RepID=UPI003D2F8322
MCRGRDFSPDALVSDRAEPATLSAIWNKSIGTEVPPTRAAQPAPLGSWMRNSPSIRNRRISS